MENGRAWRDGGWEISGGWLIWRVGEGEGVVGVGDDVESRAPKGSHCKPTTILVCPVLV